MATKRKQSKATASSSNVAPLKKFKRTKELVGGLSKETYQYTWRIQDFLAVKNQRNIEKKTITVEDAEGQQSNWTFCLLTRTSNGMIGISRTLNWVQGWKQDATGMYYKVEKPQKKYFAWQLRSVTVITKLDIEIKDRDGNVFYTNAESLGLAHRAREARMSLTLTDRNLFRKSLPPNQLPLIDGDLVIHLTFSVYATVKAPESDNEKALRLTAKLEDYAQKKLERDLGSVWRTDPNADIVFITKDGKHLSAHKFILITRNPVIEAMFKTDFSEKETGQVKVDDISSKTMTLLLDYWYTGKLDKSWGQVDIVEEFLYAAGKYQEAGLLEYLDGMLASVCNAKNVWRLMGLAENLNLKTAARELKEFAGTTLKSVDDVLELLREIR